jgi:elongation factor G
MLAGPHVHVVSIALTPKIVGDDALVRALFQLKADDPAIRIVSADSATGRVVVAGVSELHLEIVVDRLRREFGIEGSVDRPLVFLKGALRDAAVGEYKHRTTGPGRREYAHVKIRLSPRPDGTGYVFENRLLGDVIPARFLSAIVQGIEAARLMGVSGGHSIEIEDVKVELFDGSYHDVDSSESAFRSAAMQAFIYGVVRAKPVVVEPVMRIVVSVPEEFLHDVMSDLVSRSGQVQSSERVNDRRIIVARVAVAHLFGFTSELNNRSHGRATYSMSFDSYQERDSFSDEGDRDSLVGAPRKPIVPGRLDAIALPEPNENDDLEDDWLRPRG